MNNKQGIVFTLMAIVISFVLILAVQIDADSITSYESAVARDHVRVVNVVINSFADYAESSLRASTYFALTNMSRILASQSDPEMVLFFDTYDDFLDGLRQCVLHPETNFAAQGTTQVISVASPCLSSAFPTLLNSFTALVNDSMNLQIIYTIDNASFTIQEQIPFEVVASVTMNVSIQDTFANWTQINKTITAFVPLVGLQDPLTSKFKAAEGVYTQGFFREYNFTTTQFFVWNTSALIAFVQERAFRFTATAPSIIGRYYGNFSASSCCGVETVLNGTEFIASKWDLGTGYFFMGADSNFSFTDHELLVSTDGVNFRPRLFNCSGGSSPQTNRINTVIQGDFWLNQSVLTTYGVPGINWTKC